MQNMECGLPSPPHHMCLLPLADGILEEPWDWKSALRTVKILYAAWNNTLNSSKQRDLRQLKRKCVLAVLACSLLPVLTDRGRWAGLAWPAVLSLS